MKYVNDTAAGKSISAYIIAKGSRKVAKVQVHYGSGGGVTVNVFQRADAALASAKAFHKTKVVGLKGMTDMEGVGDFYAQAGKATGYGYDKLTAALSGLYIDGHVMTDHCSREGAPKPPRGRKTWPRDAKPRKGYSFANFATLLDGERVFSPEERYLANKLAKQNSERVEQGYTNCYRESGLDYFKALGYNVWQAI